jgi:hypothetical protein
VNNLRLQDPIERWLIFIETIRIESKAYCKRKRYHERAIKDLCERKLEALEQNPLLPTSKSLNSQYEYYRALLNKWTADQISGYQIRIKAQPKFEPGEPNISFFADMEKKTGNKKNITELKDINGELQYEPVALKEIAVDYYKELFSEKKTDTTATQKLLDNVKNKISLAQRASLDQGITLEELEKAVKKLQKGKSPGPDGIPAEFYQLFWDKIQTMYLDFINAVKRSCFPANKNVSITTLIFKEKGERCSLKNYRPITLMNVDIKILTKLLSIRLNLVLPTIIHDSQTAVYGRVIGDNINLIRDLIDLSNKNEEEAALLFLDQEKAFDRVSHNVMLKTLNHFGFGPNFISWIEILYSNASTRVDINGFLTEKVQLKSGVRQGCPLSPLLYVLIIELLGLLLRSNQNIVGFQIEGDRLISSHYSDDAVIKITQNRCFKEVYKDLTTYENGTGARINYDKTKGLWLGKWRGRIDDPFEDIYTNPNQQIKWTSTNVKYLGVYVGNDNPDLCTFQDIIPKVKKRLHYWKPLSLPILSKSRVIEIFHASKLWYAASFYPIPSHFSKDLNDAFMDYIIFPKNKAEVSKMEMEKERAFGGIKLMNIQLKSITPKITWLMRLLTDNGLRMHVKVFEQLLGIQKGGLTGKDVIFADQRYMTAHLECTSIFYREALCGISKLDIWKHIPDINNEHLYYNPIFSTVEEDDDGEQFEEKTLAPFHGNKTLMKIHTYGELLAAIESPHLQPKLKAVLSKKRDLIRYIRPNVEANSVSGYNTALVNFKDTTQKFIYSELIHRKSTDHIYQIKWSQREDIGALNWDNVWEACHQQFFSEDVKSTVWEQMHLNFYTTYNYNKWHNSLHPCPLCRHIPEDIFHILIDCKFTRMMWNKIQCCLTKIDPLSITNEEMGLGMISRTKNERKATTLRNWITFSLRHHIMKEERKAYYLTNYTGVQEQAFVDGFNYSMAQELSLKRLQYSYRGEEDKFDAIATTNGVIGTKVGDNYVWKNIC